jgi:hypothetical protein
MTQGEKTAERSERMRFPVAVARGRSFAREVLRQTRGSDTLGTVLPRAPVAQLDRAIASGAIGREFESLRARH